MDPRADAKRSEFARYLLGIYSGKHAATGEKSRRDNFAQQASQLRRAPGNSSSKEDENACGTAFRALRARAPTQPLFRIGGPVKFS
jgi:hypothetical protein